jgi:hypothetical protein
LFNEDAILHVKAVLINVAKTNISTETYEEFEAAGLRVIEELKAADKQSKGADVIERTKD